MNYKNPNYNSWVAVPTIELDINNLYIENVYLGKDSPDEHIYVLINKDGTQESIDYIDSLRKNENYENEEDIDIDFVLMCFKVNNFKNDYNHIINGNFDKLSSDYLNFSINHLGNCLAKSKNGFIPFYETLKMILLNDDKLLLFYWKDKKNADDWLLEVIADNGVYFSTPENKDFFNKRFLEISNN